MQPLVEALFQDSEAIVDALAQILYLSRVGNLPLRVQSSRRVFGVSILGIITLVFGRYLLIGYLDP